MSDSVQTFGLSIHLVSFHIPENLYGNGDDIRIGVTTLPEHIKANYSLPASKLDYANHVFTVHVQVPTQECKDLPLNATHKIIVSIRKKSFFSYPMIGSAIIHAADFPKLNGSDPNSPVSDEIKKIDIYEPIEQQRKEIQNYKERGLISPFDHTDHNTVARKTIGYMEVQFSLAPPMEDDGKVSSSYLSRKSSANNLSNSDKNNNSKSSFKQTISKKFSSLMSSKNNMDTPAPDTSYHHFD